MIVADVADNYAKVLGKEFVKLKNPDPIACEI